MHTAPGPDGSRSLNSKAMGLSFLLTAVLDIGVAITAFQAVKSNGGDDRLAYLVSTAGPFTMIAITWVRTKTLSGASLVIVLFLLLSAAAAFIGGSDSRLLIVKDSAVTGGFGLACLVSLLLPRPLMFYFGAKFATDGTRQGLSYWNGLWQYPEFRRSQYLINNVWGVAYLCEAAVRVVIAYTVDGFAVANAISTILPWAFLAVLITFTVTVGKRTQQAALAKRQQAAPTPLADQRRAP
ncbi:MAG: hypothetical protein JWM40_2766 [Frankiales bacterium]|nr:hypothetical protein [Frankiales bacterium]